MSGNTNTTEDYYFVYLVDNVCNEHGCLLQSRVADGMFNDQVRLLPLCMTGSGSTEEDLVGFNHDQSSGNDCQFPSNSSALVFSMARDISADEIDYTIPETGHNLLLSLKNPRRTYSVTVGRLSWEAIDLAEHYGAKCTAGADCDGLYFPLSNGNQHVVLGKDAVPTPWKPFYTHEPYEWGVLAMAHTQTGESMQGEVLYPPNYKYASGSANWTQTPPGIVCSYRLSPYINSILQRHLYSKDSVQPAYTAGVFWLFQNAVLRDIAASNATTDGGSSVRLAFEGNIQWLSSHASIPLTSAIILFAGITIVLLIGVLTTYWACSSHKQRVLADSLTANSVAAMIAGRAQYPPYFVQTHVLASNGSATKELYAADEFEIEEMTLRHKRDLAVQGATFHRPGAAMLSIAP